MKRTMLILCVSLAPLALAACDDGYGYGGVYSGGSIAYDGYYDDYYGPVYDGYWGNDGYFYYRRGAQDRHFRRGDAHHFRRDPGDGHHGGRTFHPMQGTTSPPKGARMPHWGGADQDHRNDRDHDHDRGRH